MSRLDEILERYPYVQRDNLIPILQDIQEEFGCLSEEAIIKVGKYLNLPTSKIFGLASFYHHFRFNKKGKYHIKVCNGTSFHANENIFIINELKNKLGIKSEEISKDDIFSLERTSCMASCGEGPVISINDTFYTKLDVDKISEIIEYLKEFEE